MYDRRSSPRSGVSGAAGVVLRTRHRARPEAAACGRECRRTATSSKRRAPMPRRRPSVTPGGEVISRLNVIDAVEANLTDAAARASPQDRAASSRSPPTSSVTTQAAANVRDNFETGSFANNDGTHRWYGNWVEQDDDNNPHGGDITIGWSDRGGKRLILTGSTALYLPSRRHALELPVRHAQVQVACATGLEAGRIRVGAGQRQWRRNLDRARSHLGPRQRFGLHQRRATTSRAFRGRDTAIRFVSSMSGRYGDDNVDIDDLEIAYTTDVRRRRPGAGRRQRAAICTTPAFAAATSAWPSSTPATGNSIRSTRTAAAMAASPRSTTRSTTWCRRTGRPCSTDTNGHGTHITSLIASSRKDSSNRYFGVAPDARIISVKAFGEDGSSSYATVIRGIDWVLNNRQQYNIRVLNLSLGAPARSRYWDDPLNKAVMRAWQSGIVVVVSAGNSGPLPQTVGVPGNVPVRHHGRRDDGQLHQQQERRSPRLVLVDGSDLRRLREARPGRSRRPRLGLHGRRTEDRGGSSDLHEQRRLLHDVGHLAGGRGRLGCRRAGHRRTTRASRPTR